MLRFMLDLLYFLRFHFVFFLLTVMLDTSISCFLSPFAGGGSNVRSGGRGVFFWGWGMGGNMPYRTIKMEPANVQLVTYIDYGIEHNDKDLKFKGSDHAKEY